MCTLKTINSSNPKITTSFQTIPLIISALILLLLFYILAPASSLIRDYEWALPTLLAFIILDFFVIIVFKFLEIKTSTLTYGDNQGFTLTKKDPWFCKKSIPSDKIRYATVEQKGWQRRLGVVDAKLFSLANNNASITLYSVPELQIEELINFIEQAKSKKGKQ